MFAGELDRETAETMSLPRCGVKDRVGSGSDSRSKRYALQGKCSFGLKYLLDLGNCNHRN